MAARLTSNKRIAAALAAAKASTGPEPSAQLATA
jgi:hypothetical protein